MKGCSRPSQSSAAWTSLAATRPSPRTSPSEWLAVAGSSIRAVASLAAGSSRRATIRASARSRRRCGARRGSTASSAMRRAVPSAASTWPCGSARTISTAGGGQQFVTAQHGAQWLNALGGPAGQVGEGSVLGLTGFAVTLTQQNGRWRASVRDDSHIHAPIETLSARIFNQKLPYYMTAIPPNIRSFQRFKYKMWAKFGLVGQITASEDGSRPRPCEKTSLPIIGQYTVAARATAWRRLRIHYPRSNRIAGFRQGTDFSHTLDPEAPQHVAAVLGLTPANPRFWYKSLSAALTPRTMGQGKT